MDKTLQTAEYERAAFEVWVAGFDSGSSLERDEDGYYDSFDVQRAWAGWQARAALASKPVPAGMVPAAQLEQWRVAVNNLATMTTKAERYALACRVKAEMTDAKSSDPAQPVREPIPFVSDQITAKEARIRYSDAAMADAFIAGGRYMRQQVTRRHHGITKE